MLTGMYIDMNRLDYRKLGVASNHGLTVRSGEDVGGRWARLTRQSALDLLDYLSCLSPSGFDLDGDRISSFTNENIHVLRESNREQ
jgi:hypothetical protein